MWVWHYRIGDDAKCVLIPTVLSLSRVNQRMFRAHFLLLCAVSVSWHPHGVGLNYIVLLNLIARENSVDERESAEAA
ncbi:hypothetical protein C3B54_111373 [Pontimonas salivibrio]|uniref:Uncharacterized protein n=1 Tax=Pontimonas salivibrio TaxID=1159327 RepID=A0A2L2BRL4_9MICO|nr:hypothetical protein C3B54_111373 [Pontimonas salivibrio]